ncbi:MAG: hypothetical protein ACQKBV_02315 [Puniceicoccales bacterium]
MMLRPFTLLFLTALIALAGCESQQRWAVPTTFVINNLAQPPKEVYAKLKRALGVSKYPLTDITVLNEDPFVFRLENVNTYAELEEARSVVERVLSRDFEPTRLAYATLTFQAVTGTAKASIQAKGDATPGAVVYVDIGSDNPVKTEVPATGEWAISIEPNPGLLGRDGEIYALIVKELTYEVIRANVFHPAGSERISKSSLPWDSSLWPLIRSIPNRELMPTPKDPDHKE